MKARPFEGHTWLIQLTLTLKMTTAKVSETSVAVNNSPSGVQSHGRSYSTRLPSIISHALLSRMLYCSQFIKHDRRRPDYLAVTKAVKEKSIDHHISGAGSMNLKVRSPYALLDARIIRFSYAVCLQALKCQNETSCAVLWYSYFCFSL